MKRATRHKKGEQHPQAKLTEQQARQIRASDWPTAELAKRYGVHEVTIRKIRRGLTWRHLNG